MINSENFSSSLESMVSKIVRLQKQISYVGPFVLLLLIIGCTKSEALPPPDLLAATIQINHKGTENEVHEIWMVDTRNQEKNLVFTTTPGTRLSLIDWGFDQSSLLYVLEIKGVGEGNLTWQLYEVDYNTKINKAFFDKPQTGLPRFVDFSSEGKWLRLVVNDMSPIGEGTWLIDTENNEFTKLDQNYASFVWSPNDPDIFAHWQSPLNEQDENAPYVVIRNINTLEMIDSIKFDSLDWGSHPFLLWSSYQPNHIQMFFHNEMYDIDIAPKNWNRVSDQLKISKGDTLGKNFLISQSGKWLLSQPGLNIEVVQMNALNEQPFRFETVLEQKQEFLSWCSIGDDECIVITTENGEIKIFELGGEFSLLRNLNLNEYGLDPQGIYFSLAKPIE